MPGDDYYSEFLVLQKKSGRFHPEEKTYILYYSQEFEKDIVRKMNEEKYEIRWLELAYLIEKVDVESAQLNEIKRKYDYEARVQRENANNQSKKNASNDVKERMLREINKIKEEKD